MDNFTPKQIGLPDTKLEAAIIDLYSAICDTANALHCLFEAFLSGKRDIPLFFEFIKSPSPKDFLYRKFIEINKINVPGLSIEKIMEFDLIDVPREDFAALLDQRKELVSLIGKAKDYRFYFPLKKLFYKVDEEISDFGISHQCPTIIQSPEFDEALYRHIRKFTKNQEENDALESIDKIIEGFNDLVKMGIVRSEKYQAATDLDDLLASVVFSFNTETPFSISPKLALKRPFSRKFKYVRFENVNTFGQPSDILGTKLQELNNEINSEEDEMEDVIFEPE